LRLPSSAPKANICACQHRCERQQRKEHQAEIVSNIHLCLLSSFTVSTKPLSIANRGCISVLILLPRVVVRPDHERTKGHFVVRNWADARTSSGPKTQSADPGCD